jgi:glucose-6-phosphate-specific signal transduction histidine kinase
VTALVQETIAQAITDRKTISECVQALDDSTTIDEYFQRISDVVAAILNSTGGVNERLRSRDTVQIH